MNGFNPLNNPILFEEPNRLSDFSIWRGHIPFAMFLMQALRPRRFVELGSHYGDSYCAFCQAAKLLPEPPRCTAIDVWSGDEHAGFYGDDVYDDLRAYHDPRYGAFSELLRSMFDDALPHFAEGEIDLLHIDGLHTYEAVKHDFETYRPKCSERAVVLLHDTAVRDKDFGVYQFWEELRSTGLPTFEFQHSAGLGVVAVGEVVPDALQPFFSADASDRERLELFFKRLGERWVAQEDARKAQKELAWTRDRLQEVQEYAAVLEQHRLQSETHRNELERYLQEVDADRQQVRLAHEQTVERLERIERHPTFRILSRLGGVAR